MDLSPRAGGSVDGLCLEISVALGILELNANGTFRLKDYGLIQKNIFRNIQSDSGIDRDGEAPGKTCHHPAVSQGEMAHAGEVPRLRGASDRS